MKVKIPPRMYGPMHPDELSCLPHVYFVLIEYSLGELSSSSYPAVSTGEEGIGCPVTRPIFLDSSTFIRPGNDPRDYPA
jgi:hypothetical protein